MRQNFAFRRCSQAWHIGPEHGHASAAPRGTCLGTLACSYGSLAGMARYYASRILAR